jgi:hypothetical protein
MRQAVLGLSVLAGIMVGAAAQAATITLNMNFTNFPGVTFAGSFSVPDQALSGPISNDDLSSWTIVITAGGRVYSFDGPEWIDTVNLTLTPDQTAIATWVIDFWRRNDLAIVYEFGGSNAPGAGVQFDSWPNGFNYEQSTPPFTSTVTRGAVEPSPVPVPGSFGLLALALAAGIGAGARACRLDRACPLEA